MAAVGPAVRCASLDGYVDLATRLGLDPAALLREVGLDIGDLAVPDKWIPATAAAGLLQLSATTAGRDDFALLLSERRRLSTLGPLSVVLREEPDLRSALELLTRYEHSYNEALRLRLSEDGGLASLRLWLELGEPAPARQPLELAAAAVMGIIRTLFGRTWEPLSVCFSHAAPADLRTHRRIFGPRLQFGHDFTGLVFYAAQLDARNALADPVMRAYSAQFLETMPARAADTVDEVKDLVEVLLPVGRCSNRQVARSLGVTTRTLHRRLDHADETFSSIVQATRSALAERYLATDRYSLTEISGLLGFTAPSAFSRWFRQHQGLSPREWRARVLGGSP